MSARKTRRLHRFGSVLGLIVTLSLVPVLAPLPVAAGAPYEPNDSIPGALGPLLVDQALVAGLEAPNDRDFFFFYVTSPPTSHAILTVKNLGGGLEASDIDAAILDSSATPVGAVSYIRKGEAGTVAVDLKPQKYFVEVTSKEGFGDTYGLTIAGNGAAGSYAEIAARCASAEAAIASTQTELSRARARLQRATARLRRTRYRSRIAHKRARAVHRRAKARLAAKRHALQAARESRSPWCFIPQ